MCIAHIVLQRGKHRQKKDVYVSGVGELLRYKMFKCGKCGKEVKGNRRWRLDLCRNCYKAEIKKEREERHGKLLTELRKEHYQEHNKVIWNKYKKEFGLGVQNFRSLILSAKRGGFKQRILKYYIKIFAIEYYLKHKTIRGIVNALRKQMPKIKKKIKNGI